LFYINPGELRTPIRIQVPIKDGEGSFAKTVWTDICSTDSPTYPFIRCKWEALKGAEKWTADSLQAVSPATVTIRYRADVTDRCRIICDGVTYSIVDISDPTQRKQWLQITVKTAVSVS
jgi:SPP1 family predicted phage head-tail adaptor